VVRAAEESIAYQIRDVLMMMNKDAAVPLRTIHADGGPTRDSFLMQFTADMVGLDLEVADVADGSALGAAMAGMLGIGLCGDLKDLAALPRKTTRLSPRMDAETVKRNAAGWEAAVARVI
jgi:glycerol kinase